MSTGIGSSIICKISLRKQNFSLKKIILKKIVYNKFRDKYESVFISSKQLTYSADKSKATYFGYWSTAHNCKIK